MSKKFPLSSRELLQDMHASLMPQDLQTQLVLVGQSHDVIVGYRAQAHMVATLIEQFEQDHGKLNVCTVGT